MRAGVESPPLVSPWSFAKFCSGEVYRTGSCTSVSQEATHAKHAEQAVAVKWAVSSDTIVHGILASWSAAVVQAQTFALALAGLRLARCSPPFVRPISTVRPLLQVPVISVFPSSRLALQHFSLSVCAMAPKKGAAGGKRKAEDPGSDGEEGGRKEKKASGGTSLVHADRIREINGGEVGSGPVIYW